MFKKIANIGLAVVIMLILGQPVLAHDYTLPGGTIIIDEPDDLGDLDDVPCDPDPDDCKKLKASPDPTKNDKKSCASGEPVYLFDGSFYYRHTDLTIPGNLPIVIRRAYDTRREFKGFMGYGWSMSYHVRLFPLASGNLLLKRGDNSRTEFIPDGNDTYSAKDGFDSIKANADGTYTLNKASTYSLVFDIDGCLEEIQDKNGNQLLLSYYSDGNDVKLLLPFSGISEYALIDTPITLGYDFQLSRIDEGHNGSTTGRYVEFSYNANGRLTLIEDFTGRQVNYQYDPNQTGDLIEMADPETNAYTYTYDSNHLITSFIGLGCSDCTLHTNIYDANEKVIQQNHGNGTTQFEYLANNRTKVTTSVYDDETLELLHTRYEYYDFDANGYTVKHIRQVGAELDEAPGSTEDDDIVTVYSYNGIKKLGQTTSPDGIQTEYTYDPNTGNLLTETVHIPDGNDVVTTYTYDANHNFYDSVTISSTFEPQVYRTEYTYDANGNIATETTFADVNDSNTAMTKSYTYDEYGNILTATAPMGNAAASEYNEYGFLTRTYDPNDANHQTLYTYDDLGNQLSITDAGGNTTTSEYDKLGRVTKVTDALGRQTINTYSGANLVQTESGKTATEDGRITIYEYDAMNRQSAVKMIDDDFDEVTLTTYTYDSEGRTLTTTDGSGRTIGNTYDELGRMIAVTDPNGFTTSYAYDKAGNVTGTTDAQGNGIYYAYDYVSMLSERTDAVGNVTSYTYNAIGNVLTVTDARDNTTTQSYDGAGRLIQVVDPGGNTTQYSYNKNGNVIGKITPNEYSDPGGADPIVYTYDNYNRLIQTDYPDGKVVTHSYDLSGNMTGWDDGTLSSSTAYDELNRVVQVTTNYPSFSKTISYTYDRFGQKTTMTLDGNVTTYNYDALGRLTSIVHPGSLTTEYEYDASGTLLEKVLPNGVTTTYSYDISTRLTKLVNTAPDESIISSYSYTFDNVGNRLTMTTQHGKHYYQYEDVYQLKLATAPALLPEFYTYDAVGNRLTSTADNDWSYDSVNRLLSYDAVTFSYDDNGNAISKTDAGGTTTYTYDYDNRLVGVSTAAHDVNYLYDPSGKRLGKIVDSAAVWFCYDDEDIIAEYNNSGVLLKTFYHGQGIDEPIAMVAASQTYYYTFDGLGSVSELTDPSAVTVESYAYDSFGNLQSLPATANPYTYTSREYEAESALYYYRARYYDAKLGRFLATDPARFRAGVNFYLYSSNNPVNYTDPYGLVNVFAGPNPAGPDDATIVCDGKGGIRVHIGWCGSKTKSSSCNRHCCHLHEMSHLADALADNPNVCKGKADNTEILFRRTYLKQSECKAYKVTRKCRALLLRSKECCEDKKLKDYKATMDAQIQANCN